MKFIIQGFLSLALILLLAGCPAPGGHGRKPIKISDLGNTTWINIESGQTFALSFSGGPASGHFNVGSATASTTAAAVSQAESNRNQQVQYDAKKPGEIILILQGTQRIFRPTDAKVAELHQPSGKTIIMTRYK